MNFKEIIEVNKNSIKAVIRKITSYENEDLEQEVYLRIWKNSDKYKEQGKLKSFVNTIARNISLDYLKSKKVKNEVLSYDEEEVFKDIKDKKPDPETKIINLERQKRILKEINKLKPKLREIIIYTEFYDLSYEDCAKKLKCPIGTVKSRVYNAKKELAKSLFDLI